MSCSDFGDSDAAREHRIALLLDAFEALAAGRSPSPEAGAFVGTAGLDWLRHGGDLAREFFRVTAPRGSHSTTSAVARMLSSSPMRRDKRSATRETSTGRIHRIE